MSTKIEGFAYHADWNFYGENTLYRDAVGLENEPSEVPATLVIGGKAFTEEEVKAMLKEILKEAYDPDGKGRMVQENDIEEIAAKHGITL